ncbi:hypothetical protein [Micromonospora zhanjiangensis]|uniref:Uncharacterized protein n=1 Tax=Micromonospora zhanjiangensis TaxID=1522057 RepID=A0ABV8KT16_9ACTN
MTTSNAPDALLLGGPRDGTLFTADDAAVVQLEIDGLIQRYLRTTSRQDHRGQPVLVYVYDGATPPDGGLPGIGLADGGPPAAGAW